MSALRSDAARSRARILEVARRHDVTTLRLNDVAREAGVGVGTVYRHFPTVQALTEALSSDTLQRLSALARDAVEAADPGPALTTFLRSALDLQLEDSGLQMVLLSDNGSPEVQEAKQAVFGAIDALLERASRVGAVRDGLTVAHLQRLVCGVEHAVRLGDPADRDLYFDIVLAGLETR